jgi:hypothetical protein
MDRDFLFLIIPEKKIIKEKLYMKLENLTPDKKQKLSERKVEK